jgi:hypothetical protein
MKILEISSEMMNFREIRNFAKMGKKPISVRPFSSVSSCAKAEHPSYFGGTFVK